jgi:glutathione S-transferase
VKLYYSPGACSQAPHIILHETGLSHDAAKVDLRQKLLEDGSDYRRVNPKGSVPALELDNGEVLTENAVILQYLGDRSSSDVFPPYGDFRRYRVLEWVNYITTELHKSFAPIFKPAASEDVKTFARDAVGERFDYVNGQLGGGPFLLGETLTLPDAYLFVMAGWAEMMLGGLDRWPNVAALRQRMLQRSAVRHVLRFEGLLGEEAAG